MKNGFQSPNYTQVPNEYLEYTCSPECKLNKAQMQIMNFVFRETFGWHEKSKILMFSISDIQNLLGLKNRKSVATYLNELVDEYKFLESIEVKELSKKVKENIDNQVNRTLQPSQKIYRLNINDGEKRRWDGALEPKIKIKKKDKDNSGEENITSNKNVTTSGNKNVTTSSNKNVTTSEAVSVEGVSASEPIKKGLKKDLKKDVNKSVCKEEEEILNLIDSRSDLHTHKDELVHLLNKLKSKDNFKYEVFLNTLEIIDLDYYDDPMSYFKRALSNNLDKGYVVKTSSPKGKPMSKPVSKEESVSMEEYKKTDPDAHKPGLIQLYMSKGLEIPEELL